MRTLYTTLTLTVFTACAPGGATLKLVEEPEPATGLTGTETSTEGDADTDADSDTDTGTDTDTLTDTDTGTDTGYVLAFDPVPAVFSRKGEVDEIVLPLPVDLAFPAGAVASWTLVSQPTWSAGVLDGGKFVPDPAVFGATLLTGEYVFTGTITFADGSAQSVDVPVSVIPEEDFQVTATFDLGSIWLNVSDEDGSGVTGAEEIDPQTDGVMIATIPDVTVLTPALVGVWLDRYTDSSCDSGMFTASCDPATVEVTFWAYGVRQTPVQVIVGDYDFKDPGDLMVVIEPSTGTWTF